MSEKLWGGRFSRDTDSSIINWTESISVDCNMVKEDLWGSMAHVIMLGMQKIIPLQDSLSIIKTLHQFQDDYVAGKWQLTLAQEDAQMNVEARLIKELGIDVGGKMHTCRSRNDQVPLDQKLYTRNRLLELRRKVLEAVSCFLDKAENHKEDVMVAYTHVQHAQPVSIAYWLSHYAAAFLRDADRLSRAYNTTDQNPLGSGAIAGTSFPIDRKLTTKLLGFQKVDAHGLDATSSGDAMLEVLSANSLLMTNISRLAEEFILWSSHEFRTLTLDDGFAMGSSMMPQKKNPGAVELLRGRCGRINGSLVAGLTMMKGLPSGYNRDFHEQKEVLVESLNLINRAVEVIPPLVSSTKINKERMYELAFANFSTATELANFLVREHAVPFRKAHHIVGSLVGKLSRNNENFSNFNACFEHLKENEINTTLETVKKVLDPKSAMLSYKSEGGTAPEAVTALLAKFRSDLDAHKKLLQRDQQRVDSAHEVTRNIAFNAINKVQNIAEFEKMVMAEAEKIACHPVA